MNNEDLILDRIITRLITEVREEDPSREDVRTAVDRLKHRLGSRLAPGHSQALPSLRSRGSAGPARWRRPMLRLGVAAAVVGTITLWQWMPTAELGAGVAFGQVLDAVRQATSMTYTAIEHPREGGGENIRFQVQGSRWLRVESPSKGIRIIDLQDSKLLQFDHPQGPGRDATLTTFVGQAAEALQGVVGPLTELNDVLPDDGRPLGNKMIDGQAVTGYRIRRASLVDDLEDHSVWDIWADSETAQVVRVDIHHERDSVRVTLVDFNFDIDFEDSMFNLQPPPGYTVVYETLEDIESGDGQ